MKRFFNYIIIYLAFTGLLWSSCGKNKDKAEETNQYEVIEEPASDGEDQKEDLNSEEVNPKDFVFFRDDVEAGLLSLGVGVVLEREKPVFFSHDLAAFALAGPVEEVRYDSLVLKYNEKGLLDFFGFNDSINLLYNIVYDKNGYSHYLKEWGENGWKFEIRGQSSFDIKKEHPAYDFLIHYPEGGYDRYIVDFKLRKDQKAEKTGEVGQIMKHYIRQDATQVEYRNFRRKGDYPRPDKFIYSDYNYDEWGNWIERRAKSEHRPTKHEKRDIKYYPLD